MYCICLENSFEKSKETKDKIIKSKTTEEVEQLNRSLSKHKTLTSTAKTNISQFVASNYNNNQMVLGIAVGAGVVTIILIFAFIVHRIYTKRRKESPKRCSSYQSSLPSQVTLLPVQTVRSCSQINLNVMKFQRNPNNPLTRSPPPYNESYIDNGGTVIVV